MRYVLLPFLFLLISRVFSFNITLLKYPQGDYYNARQGIRLFIEELRKRTNIDVEDKLYEISLDDPEIFNHYFLILNGHVPVNLNNVQKRNLRLFIENGGFLFANDDYGIDKSFRALIKEVFSDYRFEKIPFSHPIYSSFYKFQNGIPKIHEHDGGPPEAYGLFIGDRLCIFYAYNTDIIDGWDPPEVHNDPEEKREEAIRMGINIVVYSLLN